ncbi:MAG: zinc ribbon domain-containing protein [Coleofasciculus sp. G3-WIS-01]|uniref:zinc ribbon domain-containing protein n=1 Tax=Coleofasciculus sp. G3-WIS-01 TaxID=3069528 RepID=UPI0032F8369E
MFGKIPQTSTKTCSQCHTVKDSMPLSERVFRCDNCGLEIARDFNASIILEWFRQLGGGEPVDWLSADTARVKQEVNSRFTGYW